LYFLSISSCYKMSIARQGNVKSRSAESRVRVCDGLRLSDFRFQLPAGEGECLGACTLGDGPGRIRDKRAGHCQLEDEASRVGSHAARLAKIEMSPGEFWPIVRAESLTRLSRSSWQKFTGAVGTKVLPGDFAALSRTWACVTGYSGLSLRAQTAQARRLQTYEVVQH
jgi:hypothetical protein